MYNTSKPMLTNEEFEAYDKAKRKCNKRREFDVGADKAVAYWDFKTTLKFALFLVIVGFIAYANLIYI